MFVWVVLGLLVLSGLVAVGIYNSFVQLRENVKNGWSQIEVQLTRRHDLIPNLVETAKGYLKHESSTLENVIKARQVAVDAKGLQNKAEAENFLTSTLRSLFAVTENYSDLKANQQMIKVQEEITSTENRLAFARQYYNDEVNRFNVSVQTFPNSVIANAFHFEKAQFFQMENADISKVPDVKF